MSFAGNNGTSGVIAHKHTSATGDGGSLDQTSLILSAPLFAVLS